MRIIRDRSKQGTDGNGRDVPGAAAELIADTMTCAIAFMALHLLNARRVKK
jgi:hypothetical protein